MSLIGKFHPEDLKKNICFSRRAGGERKLNQISGKATNYNGLEVKISLPLGGSYTVKLGEWEKYEVLTNNS